MLWCVIGIVISLVGLALTALVIRPSRLDLRPDRLLRGCIALGLLLLALGVIGVALLATSGAPLMLPR